MEQTWFFAFIYVMFVNFQPAYQDLWLMKIAYEPDPINNIFEEMRKISISW